MPFLSSVECLIRGSKTNEHNFQTEKVKFTKHNHRLFVEVFLSWYILLGSCCPPSLSLSLLPSLSLPPSFPLPYTPPPLSHLRIMSERMWNLLNTITVYYFRDFSVNTSYFSVAVSLSLSFHRPFPLPPTLSRSFELTIDVKNVPIPSLCLSLSVCERYVSLSDLLICS